MPHDLGDVLDTVFVHRQVRFASPWMDQLLLQGAAIPRSCCCVRFTVLGVFVAIDAVALSNFGM